MYVTEKLLEAFNDKPFVVVAQIKKKSENNKCIYNAVLLENDVFMLFLSATFLCKEVLIYLILKTRCCD